MQENYGTNILAILSLIVSILSVLCCCLWYVALLLGIVAVVLGVLGLRSDNPKQKDAAIAGIIVGAVGFALAVSVGVIHVLVLSGFSSGTSTAM